MKTIRMNIEIGKAPSGDERAGIVDTSGGGTKVVLFNFLTSDLLLSYSTHELRQHGSP